MGREKQPIYPDAFRAGSILSKRGCSVCTRKNKIAYKRDMVYRRCVKHLADLGIEVAANYVGELLTTQEQAGFQMSMVRMNDQLLEYWNAPCNTAYFKK